MTDKEIIEGCKKGNRRAQEALYKTYASKIMGVCMRYSKDKMEAEDVFQEAFIRAFNHIQSVRESDSLAGWLRRIAVTTAINMYHKNKKHNANATLEYYAEEDGHSYEHILDQLSVQELMALVDQLPEGYRMVFNLYVVEGFAHNEIAELLGINVGTSKSQLSRAKAMLKSMLEKSTRLDYPVADS